MPYVPEGKCNTMVLFSSSRFIFLCLSMLSTSISMPFSILVVGRNFRCLRRCQYASCQKASGQLTGTGIITTVVVRVVAHTALLFFASFVSSSLQTQNQREAGECSANSRKSSPAAALSLLFYHVYRCPTSSSWSCPKPRPSTAVAAGTPSVDIGFLCSAVSAASDAKEG